MTNASNTVVVIGKGRFGNAIAQGFREGFIISEDGDRVKCDVVQLSATKFTSLSVEDQAAQLRDVAFVAYCGKMLHQYARTMAKAVQHAVKTSTSPPLEFIDFSNPDPGHEKDDVSGTVDLWVALNAQGRDEEGTKSVGALVKVWKITEVGSIDVSGIVGNTDGLVYSSEPGLLPRIAIPNLTLKSAGATATLPEEARTRIMERAQIDCWHDGNILGLAMLLFTSTYSIIRYDENLNGKVPHANIVMYLIDKGVSWTALWMFVISPFGGNMLSLMSIYQKWGRVNFLQKMVTIFCSLIMIIPTILYSITWGMWLIGRNMYFGRRFRVGDLYLGQSPDVRYEPRTSWVKATLVDMVNMKGETGCVGFVYALIHSFLGCIVCDPAYKSYWFDPDSGRLLWRFELSMMTAALSTGLLWVVAMRTIMGKASHIRLKPLYTYVSPIGIWFGVIHVMAYGAKGWYKLFDEKYHKGQPSITWVSSMYPAGILLVHHIMQIFGTKKINAGDYLWKHSIVNIASGHSNGIARDVVDADLGVTARGLDLSTRPTKTSWSGSDDGHVEQNHNESEQNFQVFMNEMKMVS